MSKVEEIITLLSSPHSLSWLEILLIIENKQNTLNLLKLKEIISSLFSTFSTTFSSPASSIQEILNIKTKPMTSNKSFFIELLEGNFIKKKKVPN